MATSEREYQDMITNSAGRTFTLSEAVGFLKVLDKHPTPIGHSIKWVTSKSKQPVSIGYT